MNVRYVEIGYHNVGLFMVGNIFMDFECDIGLHCGER